MLDSAVIAGPGSLVRANLLPDADVAANQGPVTECVSRTIFSAHDQTWGTAAIPIGSAGADNLSEVLRNYNEVANYRGD